MVCAEARVASLAAPIRERSTLEKEHPHRAQEHCHSDIPGALAVPNRRVFVAVPTASRAKPQFVITIATAKHSRVGVVASHYITSPQKYPFLTVPYYFKWGAETSRRDRRLPHVRAPQIASLAYLQTPLANLSRADCGSHR